MGIAVLSRIGRYGTSSSGSTYVFQELFLNRRFVFFEERGCFRVNKIVFLLVSYVDQVNNVHLTREVIYLLVSRCLRLSTAISSFNTLSMRPTATAVFFLDNITFPE